MDFVKIYVWDVCVFKGKIDFGCVVIGGFVVVSKYGNFDRSLKLYLLNCLYV